MEADPIGLVGGVNLWGYVTNPSRYSDPLGLESIAASPFGPPLPLPPVFFPGTPENDAFVKSVLDAGRAINDFTGNMLRSWDDTNDESGEFSTDTTCEDSPDGNGNDDD